ncbi:hypothetical protein DN730_03060 [Marinomonas piezotolerans]|uniref:Uncharacterized protein n=1 Tax=Marinomonas piezotolerans TaxID=2213058 RepID=A0A370UE21_9GAMM|nr:DNA-binding protein [Marinomonas piezotolerans]RDL46037.1 hypothetical protein DN730_03060 [Marinomonas piezotolerans]
MARKANIAKEEIIEACWILIEQNTFPNIPRLTEYFKRLDGRGCSNTTLLNAITEWEETYREQQESDLSDLAEHIAPSVKRFSRDLVQSVSVLLDEKIRQHEDALSLRKASLEGRSDSLSEALTYTTDALQETRERLSERSARTQFLEEENEKLKQHQTDILARNRVLESELGLLKQQLNESDAKLNQAQVDLAKQDNQIDSLQVKLRDAQAELTQLKMNHVSQYDQSMKDTLTELRNITKSLGNKQGDA